MSSLPPSRSATAEELERALGLDRLLALHFTPPGARPAIEALHLLDAAMGDVVARSTQPALGRIKLAWWRERLEELDCGPAVAEPRLRAIAEEVLPLGVSGAELAGLEPGWATLLDEAPDPALVAGRGAKLFRLAAKCLGQADERLDEAGSLYALAMTSRRGMPDLLAHAAESARALQGHRFRAPLRSITMLARLAARDLDRAPDLEPEGSRGRILAALAHRWTGLVVRRS